MKTEITNAPLKVAGTEPGIDIHRVVSRDVAARFIGVSPATFKRINAEGRGPRRIQLSSHRVGYRYVDLIAWLDARVVSGGA